MSKTTWFPFAVTTGFLVAAIALGEVTERRIPEPLAIPLDHIDSQISHWTEISQRQLDPGILKKLDPTTYLARTYQKGSSQIDLFIAYYAQQRAGESMHSPQHCLPGAGWEFLRRGSAKIDVAGKQVEINKDVIENLGARLVMLYWYQSRSRIVASEYRAKILLARDTALTGHTAGSIVRITVPDDIGAATEGLQFATALIPKVQDCLGHE